MILPFFKHALETFPEPYRKLVSIMNYYFGEEGSHSFSNYVISGTYDGKEKCNMVAWSIIGIAPEYKYFLECHFAQVEKALLQFKAVGKLLPTAPNLRGIDPRLLGGIIQKKLGESKTHAIGMISLQETTKNKQQFVVLWVHPNLERSWIEYIMKDTIEDRIKT